MLHETETTGSTEGAFQTLCCRIPARQAITGQGALKRNNSRPGVVPSRSPPL